MRALIVSAVAVLALAAAYFSYANTLAAPPETTPCALTCSAGGCGAGFGGCPTAAPAQPVETAVPAAADVCTCEICQCANCDGNCESCTCEDCQCANCDGNCEICTCEDCQCADCDGNCAKGCSEADACSMQGACPMREAAPTA